MFLYDLPPRYPENIPQDEIHRYRFAGGPFLVGYSDYEISIMMSRSEFELNSEKAREQFIIGFVQRRGIEN